MNGVVMSADRYGEFGDRQLAQPRHPSRGAEASRALTFKIDYSLGDGLAEPSISGERR